MDHLLDNPIWNAITTKQSHFNCGDVQLKYFDPEVSPFVAMQRWDSNDLQYLDQHVPAGRNFFHIIAQPIELPASCSIRFSIPLYQMVCHALQPYHTVANGLRDLHEQDIPAMVELTALTKPGPFMSKTHTFGNYTGIFESDLLVAMAGERLKVPGYTEVSAICTHPGHSGKGYAALLLSLASEKIIQTGALPFLHVRHDNVRALRMYEKAGFIIRREVQFAIFRKD
jgi:GNAT superfamily N-acetyltransferase